MITRSSRLLTAIFISVIIVGVPARATRRAWPGDRVGRVESLAALQTLRVALLSHDSATLVLDDWCAEHGIGTPGSRVAADRDTTVLGTPTADQRRLLGVTDGEPIRYRRVRLRCGDVVMSEADNWYVPSRLTPRMNTMLDTTDIPFGRVVQPLEFHRRTLSTRLLWSPLPTGWDTGTPIPADSPVLDVPEYVAENQALLLTSAGLPFSVVVERYTGNVLDFSPPRRTR